MTSKSFARYLMASCLVVAVAASGCASSTSPDDAAAAGTYTLTAISGGTPPVVTIPNGAGGCVGTVNGGSFILNSDNSYSLQLNARFTCPTPPINNLTASEQGTWSASGNTITFTGPNILGPGSATLNGNTMSVSMNVTSYGSPAENNHLGVPTTWQK